jgi:hypothetical protein
MAQGQIIDEWPRNARETIRVSLSEFNGTPTVDIRVWFNDGVSGMKPGRSGLTLSTKHLPKLAAALANALGEAQTQGAAGANEAR